MDRVGRLLLAVLLMSASICTVQGKITRYWIQYYETRSDADTTIIFRPPATEKVKNKGWGWAKHNDDVHLSGGFVLGSTGGMSWYHNTDALEYVLTLTFSTHLDGIWKGSSLNLRGVWKRTPDGDDPLPEQELSIVGGQGGLRGASGSVYYKQVQSKPTVKYLVTCDVYVDDYLNLMPKTHLDLASLYKNGTALVHDSPETTDDVLKQVSGSP